MYLGAKLATDSGPAAPLPVRCAFCPVRRQGMCAALPDDALRGLSMFARRRKLEKGQTLHWEGDAVPLALAVVTGMLKLASTAQDGSEQIVGLVSAGSFVGKPLGGTTHERITALDDCELCVFPADLLRDFVAMHPEMMAVLFEQAIADLDSARHWMRLLGRGSASERVAALLVEMASRRPDETRHRLPLSRSEMADFTGLTIETVSRQLSRFRHADIIALPSRDSFEVRDLETLTQIAGMIPGYGLH